jgi:hypothetical protein
MAGAGAVQRLGCARERRGRLRLEQLLGGVRGEKGGERGLV